MQLEVPVFFLQRGGVQGNSANLHNKGERGERGAKQILFHHLALLFIALFTVPRCTSSWHLLSTLALNSVLSSRYAGNRCQIHGVSIKVPQMVMTRNLRRATLICIGGNLSCA